jgi:DNA-binding NtrC family response regulator
MPGETGMQMELGDARISREAACDLVQHEQTLRMNLVRTIVDELWALLVHFEEEPVASVGRMLPELGIGTRRVPKLSAARAALREPVQPSLVLTDTSLPDGTWFDVLKATRSDPTEVPVIVVSALVDMRLYLDVMEKRAHDFVVPPLTCGQLAHVIGGAILKGRARTAPQYAVAKHGLRL